MATKLPATFFLGNGWRGLNCNSNPNVRLSLPSRRYLLTSCKIRHRNSRFQQKKQQEKNLSPEPLPVSETLQQSDDESTEIKMTPVDIISYSDPEMSPNDTIQPNSDESAEVQNDKEDSIPSLNKESTSNNEADITFIDQNNSLGYLDSSTSSREPEPSTETAYTAEKLSNIQLEDLIGMIRNAEKNVLLLNQARVRALEDLDQIVTEKDALQGEINTLEMRLAETDARIQVAAQEKIHMKLLEDQLENLKNELSERGDFEGHNHDIDENNKENLDTGTTVSHETRFYSLSMELRSIRKENITLKDDILELKKELSNFKGADERMLAIENERSTLDAAVKDLESRLAAAQNDVLKISTLEFECKDLRDEIGYLQGLLDKTTKQADRAIDVLQQNQELQKKVDRLEESLQEADLYRLSSEKMQQYNELMQQKMQLLQERLEKSDQEIQSHIQLYQESVLEFQDIVGSLKEDSKSRPSYEPIEDLPGVFWSRLLLIVDGWLLENKISSNDAKLLREMVWKRDRRICEAYLTCKEKNESEVVAAFMKLISSSPTSLGLHIIHIAAEMAPVAKVGGLGDVVSGLSKALQKKGHLVEVVLPKYDCIQCDRVGDMRALDMVLESFFDGQLYKNKVWVGTVEGLPVYFIEPLHPSNFFSRGQFYGEHDDFKRFSYFSRAALELLLQAGKKPDIIHCHDWQTAFVAPLYWDLYAPKGLNSARVVFTCHNFEYQGTAHASELASCGLDVHRLNRPDRMQDHSARDRINPVKGAVVYSNIVTTVSPTYAQEVRTSQGGHGLHATLNFQSKKFIGILNGIDTDAWDPSTDTFLKVQYNVDDLQGKAENKEALRKHLGLSSANVRQPLVGCITRLVPQKGVHLIRHAIYRMLELGGQFVLLGSSPVPHIQREFEEITDHFKDHPNVRLVLKYDEVLSHSIYAASDMFIIPSIFEPCDLTQMISMRYGSVPIVRKTGGLNDRIKTDDQVCSPLVNSRSSGLGVSTAAGSTAAMISAGGFKMPISREELQYMVREPILPEGAANSSSMHGLIKSRWYDIYRRFPCLTFDSTWRLLEISSGAPKLKVFFAPVREQIVNISTVHSYLYNLNNSPANLLSVPCIGIYYANGEI